MADTATKLPIKAEKTAPVAAAEEQSAFAALRREIDRLFDEFRPFGWRLRPIRPAFDIELPKLRDVWQIAPAVDLVEKDKEYEITAELPGIDEKNLEIRLVNNVLTIKGEKNEEKEQKDGDYYLSERRYGSFNRSFQLPEGVDADRIKASFGKGVLKVSMPKTAEAQTSAKKIEVKAA